jgi:flagellar biosynthesis/type III secretory pathway protein FliH
MSSVERSDDEAMFLLINLIETYFPVPEELRERYRQLISREEYRKVQEVEMTWADRLRQEGHDKGREEGREEGREAGLIEGKQQTLKRLLTVKFGALSPGLLESIDALGSAEELDRYLDRVITAATLSDLGLPE